MVFTTFWLRTRTHIYKLKVQLPSVKVASNKHIQVKQPHCKLGCQKIHGIHQATPSFPTSLLCPCYLTMLVLLQNCQILKVNTIYVKYSANSSSVELLTVFCHYDCGAKNKSRKKIWREKVFRLRSLNSNVLFPSYSCAFNQTAHYSKHHRKSQCKHSFYNYACVTS